MIVFYSHIIKVSCKCFHQKYGMLRSNRAVRFPESIMREYLKILSSIIIALICSAILISIVAGVHSYLTEQSNILGAFLFPFVVAWVGFLMFGVIGSLLWLLFLHLLRRVELGYMRKHIISSVTSAFLCVTILALFQVSGSITDLLSGYFLLIFVLPIVCFSLYIYHKLYRVIET